MNEKKKQVIEKLKKKGIDPIEVERKVIKIMRNGGTSLEIREYLTKIVGEEEE